MNNCDNELERWAREKIRRDQRFRPNCNVIIGPMGATARFNNSSNKIIHNFKRIPFKCKKKQVKWCSFLC